MAEWVRPRSHVVVLLKDISLLRVKCTHVGSHVPSLGQTWVRLAVTVHIDGRPGCGEAVTVQINSRSGHR